MDNYVNTLNIYVYIYILCYAFEEKKNFCHHNLMKKAHSKLCKKKLENIP